MEDLKQDHEFQKDFIEIVEKPSGLEAKRVHKEIGAFKDWIQNQKKKKELDSQEAKEV